MNKKSIFFILFCVLSLTVSSIFASESVIFFAIDPTKPPMQFLDERGKAIGFEIDLINAMARYGDFKPVFKRVSWQNLFSGLDKNEFDAVCATVSVTEQRRDQMEFSIPYYKVKQAILALPDSGIASVEDLIGKKIGVKRDTTSRAALGSFEKVKPIEFPNVPAAIKALYAGEVDAVICDGPVAGYYSAIKKDTQPHLEIVLVLEQEVLEMYAIAVRKGNRELRNRLNRALQLVQKNNMDVELQKKWFSELLEQR